MSLWFSLSIQNNHSFSPPHTFNRVLLKLIDMYRYVTLTFTYSHLCKDMWQWHLNIAIYVRTIMQVLKGISLLSRALPTEAIGLWWSMPITLVTLHTYMCTVRTHASFFTTWVWFGWLIPLQKMNPLQRNENTHAISRHVGRRNTHITCLLPFALMNISYESMKCFWTIWMFKANLASEMPYPDPPKNTRLANFHSVHSRSHLRSVNVC